MGVLTVSTEINAQSNLLELSIFSYFDSKSLILAPFSLHSLAVNTKLMIGFGISSSIHQFERWGLDLDFDLGKRLDF